MNVRKIPGQYRQGDILIERVGHLPTAEQKQNRGEPIILAHGEVTGHHHKLDTDKADWWKDPSSQVQHIRPAGRAAIVHQEHGPIPVKSRLYKITRQREYTPEAIRNVTD